ncbi:uncharacterized protein LOC115665043 [Syzygium oleosum]|uniref:uncharacterized protein LOC115665043 n=1 Tax=Syzygium oleosum TaxID=219896 RepID=UPI0011D1F4E6|nr:uncharacterized protein LOC115665043 [Syzygium oleosum]
MLSSNQNHPLQNSTKNSIQISKALKPKYPSLGIYKEFPEKQSTLEKNKQSTKKMATLQKFKLFAAQCGVAPSPTRSPRASPVVQLRRQSQKTTLRMLFTRGGVVGARRVDSVEPELGHEKKKKSVSGRTLKDLFVSPPPSPERDHDRRGGARGDRSGGEEVFPFHAGSLGGLITGPGSPRPVFMGLRFRSLMLRKAWRPTLETIPE